MSMMIASFLIGLIPQQLGLFEIIAHDVAANFLMKVPKLRTDRFVAV